MRHNKTVQPGMCVWTLTDLLNNSIFSAFPSQTQFNLHHEVIVGCASTILSGSVFLTTVTRCTEDKNMVVSPGNTVLTQEDSPLSSWGLQT